MATTINHLDNSLTPSASRKAAKTEAPSAPVAETKKKQPVPSATVSLNQPASPTAELYTPTGVTEKSNVQKVSSPPSKTAADAAQRGSSNAGGFVAGTGNVVVDIKQSDSGYENKIYYSTDNFATKHLLGTDNNEASINLGNFKPGTKIDFAIDNGQGDLFKAGAASQNSDNFNHAQITKSNDGVTIGFEDLKGGGDKDFNDAIIQVRNTTPPAVAPPTGNKPPHDNRSGLGDGTNPGQGAGTVNSSNQGTLNPGKAPTRAPTPPAPTVTPPASHTTTGNRSGNGDGTNPGKGAGIAHSPNQVTLNPGKVATNASTTTPPVAPEASHAPAKDNRSGLGDGTNPGRGAGTVNSPNQGTLNPGNVSTNASETTPVTVTEVSHTTTTGNRSGLADDTNPGQGAGKLNSPNQGTLNPTQAVVKDETPPPVTPIEKSKTTIADVTVR